MEILWLKSHGETHERIANLAGASRRTVMFVDASHFVLASFLGWVWCVTRLFVRAASGRQRFNVLGAINAITHELTYVSNHTYVTATTVGDLLRKIAAAGLPTPITLLLDNGTRQRGLPTLSVGARCGQTVGDRVALSAVIFTHPESHRAALEVREKRSTPFSLPYQLRRFSRRN